MTTEPLLTQLAEHPTRTVRYRVKLWCAVCIVETPGDPDACLGGVVVVHDLPAGATVADAITWACDHIGEPPRPDWHFTIWARVR
jgi:hypothetical protein